MLLCRIMRAENGDLRAYGVDGIELREHAKRRRAHLTGDEQSDRSPDRDRDSKGRIIPRRMRRHPASRRWSVAHAVHGSANGTARLPRLQTTVKANSRDCGETRPASYR